jgi:hypothetical protein
VNSIRVEAKNGFEEVVDFIDLRDGADIDRIIRAGEVLRAKRAAEIGDIILGDSIELGLEIKSA